MKQMSDKKHLSFKDYFQEKFKEWENLQPNKRSYISAFARWLSENKFHIEIKQQMASDWYHGKYAPKDDGYLLVLEEKFGEEIYEILEVEDKDRPDPKLFIVKTRWEFMPLEWKNKIAEEAARYEAQNISERVSETSKRGKPRNSE